MNPHYGRFCSFRGCLISSPLGLHLVAVAALDGNVVRQPAEQPGRQSALCAALARGELFSANLHLPRYVYSLYLFIYFSRLNDFLINCHVLRDSLVFGLAPPPDPLPSRRDSEDTPNPLPRKRKGVGVAAGSQGKGPNQKPNLLKRGN